MDDSGECSYKKGSEVRPADYLNAIADVYDCRYADANTATEVVVSVSRLGYVRFAG